MNEEAKEKWLKTLKGMILMNVFDFHCIRKWEDVGFNPDLDDYDQALLVEFVNNNEFPKQLMAFLYNVACEAGGQMVPSQADLYVAGHTLLGVEVVE